MSPLCVVMPVYNEEKVIDVVLGDIAVHILDRVPGATAIVVDDGSKDSTNERLTVFAATDPRFRILRQENAGHGPALHRALDAADSEWIFHVDSDGQFLVSEFWNLWQRREKYDLLLGVRKTRHDPKHRLALTRCCRLVIALLGGRSLKDPNVPFHLLRKSLWNHLAPAIAHDTFAPSLLVALGAQRAGARLLQTEVTHLRRPYGQSTLRLWRLARAASVAFIQTTQFRFRRVARFEAQT